MNKQQLLLAKVIHDLSTGHNAIDKLSPNELKSNIRTFDGRMYIQKMLHLVQSLGIKTNYNFKWYRFGAFSLDLLEDVGTISSNQELVNDMLKVTSLDPLSSEIIINIKNFLRRCDQHKLITLSSIKFIIDSRQATTPDKIYDIVGGSLNITMEEIRVAFRELVDYETEANSRRPLDVCT